MSSRAMLRIPSLYVKYLSEPKNLKLTCDRRSRSSIRYSKYYIQDGVFSLFLTTTTNLKAN